MHIREEEMKTYHLDSSCKHTMRLILMNSKKNLKESWEGPGEIALGVFAGTASSVWRAGLEKTQYFNSYLCGLLLEGELTLCFYMVMAETMGG